MEKNFFYSRTEDAAQFIKEIDDVLTPIFKKFIEKGYTPEQISHGLIHYITSLELNYYLGL